jgi:hypothetical protein
MSADNTILIARLPNGEYRVAEIQNYEEYFDNDFMTVEEVDMKRTYSFVNTTSFITLDDALICARKLEDEADYVEYGICVANFNRPLLDITREVAGKWWDEKFKSYGSEN